MLHFIYVSSSLSWEYLFTGNFQSKLRYIIRVFLFIPRVWVSYHNVFTKGILKHETNKKLTKKKHNSNLVLSKKNLNKATQRINLPPFGTVTYENHRLLHRNGYICVISVYERKNYKKRAHKIKLFFNEA